MSYVRLAAAAGLSLAFATPGSAQPVQTIVLYSHGYSPNPIQLSAGRPVTLTFVNRSGKGHDFTARSFFANSRIVSGRADGGEVGMGPGQSRTVTLVPRAGRYKVHCSHFLHKQLGMKGTIIVSCSPLSPLRERAAVRARRGKSFLGHVLLVPIDQDRNEPLRHGGLAGAGLERLRLHFVAAIVGGH